MLVVIGIIALLLAIMLPPLQAAHKQATATTCRARLREIGAALQNTLTEYRYYPVWDDGSNPYRFTWIDVLVQQHELATRRAAYCPDDPRPDYINSARGHHHRVLYPGRPDTYGIDYSYGIGVPLASGGWNWRPGYGDGLRRVLVDHEKYPAERLLAADSTWSAVYNLSGDALENHDWSYPTQYDNTIAWRHPGPAANALFQDGHVERIVYNLVSAEPINTSKVFLWYAGESANVNPSDQHGAYYYPNTPPANLRTGEAAPGYPYEMLPGHYTSNMLWTITK